MAAVVLPLIMYSAATSAGASVLATALTVGLAYGVGRLFDTILRCQPDEP